MDNVFADPDTGNYSLKPDSEVYELLPDFEAIPADGIERY